MNVKTWLLTAVAIGIVAVVIAYFDRPTATPPVQSAAPKSVQQAPNARPVPSNDDIVSTPTSQSLHREPARSVGPLVNNDTSLFQIDDAGKLVLNEQTRLDIEALVAQTKPEQLHAAVREQTESLPPAAAKAAEELAMKFVQYQQAQRQTYPPDQAPLTPEDAIRELEGLHALREAHFGAEVARQLYGREEAIAREMIEVMRLEADQSLTPEEKMERAEALREQLPGVAAIEQSNRESVPAEGDQEN